MDFEKQRGLIRALRLFKQGLDVNGNPVNLSLVGIEASLQGANYVTSQARAQSSTSCQDVRYRRY